MLSVSARSTAVPPNSSASSSGDISISTVWEVAAERGCVASVVPVVLATSATVATARSVAVGPGCDGSGVGSGAGVGIGAGFSRRCCWDDCCCLAL